MQVYTFKILLISSQIELVREIEILSNATVAHLGYSVLASVDASGSHLFNIQNKGSRFEFIYDNMDIFDTNKCYYNPALYTLEELDLSVNDELSMEYDYGAYFQFNIKLISISEMKKGTHSHYPYIIKGIGKKLDEENHFEDLTDEDKKEIRLDAYNYLLKGDIRELKGGYEQHIVNNKKTKLIFNDILEQKYEVNEKDWKLFRNKLIDWQENFIEKTIEKYKELLNKNIKASKKFWELDKLIKKDKKQSGIMVYDIRRSNMVNEIIELIQEKAIKVDDLEEFSDELKIYINNIVRYLK